MNKIKPKSDRLREKAEELLHNLPSTESLRAHDDLLQVVHELHVHQIELELQNDELLQAHKALEKSREDYMRLYHDAPVGYVVLDQSGITRKVNKTFAEMLSGDPATMSGTPFADFLVPEDRPIFRARLKAFYKNPFNKQIDVRLSSNDTPFYVSLRAIVDDEREHSESTNELLVTVTDINERQRYQAALEEKRRELEEILSSISDGFIALDKDLKIQYFNNAAEKMIGAQRQEVIGRQLFDAFPEAKGSEFEIQYCRALESQEVLHFETHFNVPPFDDWYEVAAYPFSDGLSVFFKVITERKEMEEKLHESKRALALYYDIATIFLTAEHDDIFHEVLNLLLQTFNSDLGYFGYLNSEGDLVCPTLTRQVWDQCQVPDKKIIFPKKSWGGLWGQSLIERRSLIANNALNAPTGHLTMENAMAIPLINHDSVIGQFVLANKKGGYSFEDLELAEKAATQTAPILQSLLDKMEKQKLKNKLDKVNRELHKVESLNRMAGAIAHNYNNLLTIVMGGIEMALEEMPEQNHRARNSLNYALQASSKGGEIGKMLLMYLGQSKGNEVITDLLQLTKEILHKYTKDVSSAVDIDFNPPEQSPVICVDPKHIEKILNNLLTNAIEAQTPENPSVTLNICSASPKSILANKCFPMEWRPLDENYVCLEVSDHGCGIDEKNIEKLFDPYYSEKFTGRGMGLAIVHGIVQIYNGVISVESKIGSGSTFRIYLPTFTDYSRKNV